MSLNAYQQASARAESPSSTEYRLFAQVTRALMQAKQAPSEEYSEVAEAVDWNRRVWNAMAMDCAQAENGLPDSLKAGIISLSLFIGRHSSVVVHDVDEVDILIDLNKTIMQGLADQAKLVANASAPQTSQSA
jgi:flagellar protein FlaF